LGKVEDEIKIIETESTIPATEEGTLSKKDS